MTYQLNTTSPAKFGTVLAIALSAMVFSGIGATSAQADDGIHANTPAKVRAQMAARKAELYMTKQGFMQPRHHRIKAKNKVHKMRIKQRRS